MNRKREHFGSCRVAQTWIAVPRDYPGWPYPTMEGAIEALDPFNERPLLHVQASHVTRYLPGGDL